MHLICLRDKPLAHSVFSRLSSSVWPSKIELADAPNGVPDDLDVLMRSDADNFVIWQYTCSLRHHFRID